MHLITTLDRGGAEAQLAKFLAHTDSGSLQHCVVSLLAEGSVGGAIRSLGIPVYSLGMRRTMPSLVGLQMLRRIIDREKPLLLQTWLYHADLLGLLVAKLAGIPLLVWNLRCSQLDMRYYPKLTKFVVRILARFSRMPDVVLANSQSGCEAHARIGYCPKRFQVIPNGFELDQFRPDVTARAWLRNELELPEDAVTIGLVARYDPMKDHRTFLSAARQIHDEHPEARFVLCGAGVDQKNATLMRQVKGYNMTQQIRLLGLREDISRITAAFDIACSSSAFGEGFSNAIGEAMASGVPCVATDVGDSAFIIGQTGRVVPPRDPTKFAKALCKLIASGSESRKCLGLQARARIAQYFDINAVTRLYEQVYHSLIYPNSSEKKMRDGESLTACPLAPVKS
jgi:glycosyltransferase involved in cell wall biosynthesis